MAKIFNFFLIIGFMIFKLYATHIPVTANSLVKFAVQLELNKALLHHLEIRTINSLYVPLILLRNALQRFDQAFYQKDVLGRFCDDPMSKISYSEIFSAAYRKDLANPFHDHYDLNPLDLEVLDIGLTSVRTLSDLKRLGLCDKVIEMLKQGDLHFKPDFNLGYVEWVKDDVRKVIISQMKVAFSNIFIEQHGYNTSFSDIKRFYNISPVNLSKIYSKLSLQMAISIFIHLPVIKFTRKID